MSQSKFYQKPTNLNDNEFITDPRIPDPKNLPVPLGWNLLVRPYPIEQMTKGGIILTSNDAEYMRNATNVARVVAIGPSCWNRSQHRDNEGNYVPWVEVGEFISYPRYKGAMRNFKGVTFCILNDDDIVEKLPDPVVFSDEDSYQLIIPEEDLINYKTIYNPDYKRN
jgi:co-chaperonin GroES (HSP10)